MGPRALLLLNRQARNGKQASDEVLRVLQTMGFELVVVDAQGAALSEVIERHRTEVDLVILGGGDGTLNAAVDGLLQTGLPLGIIPLGTANDLARTLGIPLDPARACQVIQEGFAQRVDVGRVNGKCFLNVASIGLAVAITRGLTKEVKRSWGVLAYLKTALTVAYRAKPFHAEIVAGATAFKIRAIQITVGNGRHYGGGMTVAQDARIDDQVLDFYSLEIQRWWQILFLLRRLRTGNLAGSKYVRTLRGRHFTVRTRSAKSINTDGEIMSETPAEFRVIDQAISVFVPTKDAVA